MNGPLYMQSCNSTVLVRRVKRRGDSPAKQLARWFVENQIGFSLNLLALLFCAHYLLPRSQAYTSKFFTLQYYNEQSQKYGLGFDDTYYVFFVVVLFTGLRAATMEYILAPFANYLGLRKKKEVTRFSEQAWLVIYCVVFWSLGVYLHYTSPAWLNLRNLWATWPNRELGGLFKFYVLTQLGFWFQQVFVINIEERRKDHWQMLSHHFITIVLIHASYRYHFNYIGNAVFILFDLGDILLSGSKCLKYAGFTNACDVGFGLFMLSWFVNRHVLFNIVCWSIYKHPSEILTRGCFRGPQSELEGPFEQPAGYGPYFEPFLKADGLVCWQPIVTNSFLALLLALQVICIVWFAMIVKVAIRVVRGAGADDVRSDDECEDEEEEEDEFVYEEAQPFEEEVGVEELDLKSWERRTGVKRTSTTATGVSLPGHSDRKELLGRIGCEKQVD
ncbi:longevity assurance proteins LAG1/LAC1 [Cryphonectria parasitica EP155]|uniref:Longevity assurance proteins LAG1/LAC1 n=1 Tax=Cryphonectria parasitica (strain ATCC 38755 / EP155) TaxID=660469 RepID=A0A9P5CSZ6_CRYP1|nr:longevity assurance proteins LAG1/LAC1 [Cryphonectria parasitica EP155]KAF3768876.1 longevity assurance proteins LAG1/LAC1 [Cryphonectria parasitica EP155]